MVGARESLVPRGPEAAVITPDATRLARAMRWPGLVLIYSKQWSLPNG
jgi:hypothetical protein